MQIRRSLIALALSLSSVAVLAQTPSYRTPAAAAAPTVIPALVPYSGTAIAPDGKPLSGEAHITFLIFKEEQGGEPLWTESQVTAVDSTGRYKVQLGASNPNGLPSDLFATGEARWLEVQIAGQQPEPRVLLASVPYALKAADAATLGGLPASAFALAGSKTAIANAASAAISPDAATTVTTTGGTANQLAKFSGANTIVNSTLYDNGTDVGIGTTTPTATLDVNGAAVVSGALSVTGTSTFAGPVVLPPTATATSSKDYSSQYLKFETSTYNSSSSSVVEPRFQLQAEPHANNTANPTATLNLISSTTNNAPTETGFSFNANGTINFAPGQTFGATSAAGVAFNGTSTSNTGVEGTSSSGSGVVGTNANTGLGTAGVLGIAGKRNTSGFTGIAGVWGDSSGSVGVYGSSDQYAGVYGESSAGPGVEGSSSNGVGGEFYGGDTAAGGSFLGGYYGGNGLEATGGSDNGGSYAPGYGGGFTGGSDIYFQGGGYGISVSGGQGDTGNNGNQTPGGAGAYIVGGAGWNGGGNGVTASGGSSQAGNAGAGGVFVGGTGYPYNNGIPGDGITAKIGFYGDDFNTSLADAGYFMGNVEVTGTISSQGQIVQVDHPLDPANKFLTHSAVESSELVNVYSGNVTTDDLGLATVELPDWFEAVNGDFRYQLTIVGRKAQAWISREVKGGRFQIASDATNVKISWLIMAVRQDAYAKAHPLVVEQTKNAHERGFYKHPELYGQPEEKQAEWGRHPEIMLQIKAMHEAARSRGKSMPVQGTTPGKPTGHPNRSFISASKQPLIPITNAMP